MRILDKRHKDYYDYLSFQYGEPDKSITFDRKDAKKITGDDLLKFVLGDKINHHRSFGYLYKEEQNYVSF